MQINQLKKGERFVLLYKVRKDVQVKIFQGFSKDSGAWEWTFESDKERWGGVRNKNRKVIKL